MGHLHLLGLWIWYLRYQSDVLSPGMDISTTLDLSMVLSSTRSTYHRIVRESAVHTNAQSMKIWESFGNNQNYDVDEVFKERKTHQ
jgi:hypothetical protein